MSVGDFVKRHRRKLFVTAGAAASVWALTRYVKNKFYELQERMLAERLAKDNLERRFEQNQRDATFTILALLPALGAQVLAKFDVEAIKRELQDLRSAGAPALPAAPSLADSQTSAPDTEAPALAESSLAGSLASSALLPAEGAQGAVPATTAEAAAPAEAAPAAAAPAAGASGPLDASYFKPPSKSQLWDEIKLQAITRAFTLVYGTALLVLLTRVQLNVLGRRTYVSSVEELAGDALPLDRSEELDHVHRQYLTFSWWLLNKGWLTLSQRVQDAVAEATADVHPRSELNLDELSRLFGRVHAGIDHAQPNPDFAKAVDAAAAQADAAQADAAALGASFLPVLLPPPELETYVLSQAPGSVVAPSAVDGELRDLLNETADLVESPNAAEVVVRLVNTGLSVLMAKLQPLFGADGTQSVKLASVLAALTRQAHHMAAGHPMSNDYVEAMVAQPQLDAFCAIIYTNF